MSKATPLKAIRAKCRDCSCGSFKAVRFCSATDCPLWPYRLGLRPETARKRYGADVMDPEKMADASTPLEDL